VKGTLVALKMDPGVPADEVARACARSVEDRATGEIIDARKAVG